MEEEDPSNFQKIVSSFSIFWEKHPSLYIALSAFLALSMSYGFSLAYLLPALILFYPYKIRFSLRIASYGFFIFFFVYGGSGDMPPDTSSGKGRFVITALKENTSFFQQKFLVYKGHLETFQTGEKTYRNIPCSVMVKNKEENLLACHDYFIEGTLKKNQSGKYSLKIKHSKPIYKGMSVAKFRFDIKAKIKAHLNRHLDTESSSLLKALLLGDVDSKHLSFFFQKLGLVHILAISGFHFTLLSAFYGFILRLLLPRNIAFFSLILLISLYAFILGPSPSVMRSWITISLYLLFQIFHRSHLSINAMGAALLILLFFYPASILDLGLQLSFLCTFAILTLYPFIDQMLQKIFSSDPLIVKKTNVLSKLSGQAGSFLRKNLALCLAVSAFSMPVILFTFHKFPLLSLFYNLFIPSFAAVSFFLLLLALSLTPFSFLSSKVYILTGSFTNAWLAILYNSPPFFDRYIYMKRFSFDLLIAMITLLSFLTILVYLKRMKNDRIEYKVPKALYEKSTPSRMVSETSSHL